VDGEPGAAQDRSSGRASVATVRVCPPERRLTGAQLARYLDWRPYAVVSSARARTPPCR
jgi:hypothetical protein